MGPHLPNAIHEMLGAAVAQIITIHAGDDDILQLHGGDGLRQMQRLIGIRGGWPAMRHVAERASRVQRSPRIMNVAVPLPKHSPILGQDASSHTVCSFCSRRIRLTS